MYDRNKVDHWRCIWQLRHGVCKGQAALVRAMKAYVETEVYFLLLLTPALDGGVDSFTLLPFYTRGKNLQHLME
jgi:hypothetical protein